MIDFGAFVDLRDVENGLRRLQLAGHDLRPVFRKSRKAVRADMRDHAKKHTGPSGGWTHLAASTLLARKQRTGKQGRKRRRPPKLKSRNILGRLPGAFKITFDAKAIRATSRVSWSGAHNDPRGARVGRGARLPGRPFLWVSQSLLVAVARNAVDYMVGAWEKKA